MRSGAIFVDGDRYILGIDRGSNDITDFGGSYIATDKDLTDTAIREVSEETNGIILLNREDVLNGKTFNRGHIYVTFIHRTVDIDDLNQSLATNIEMKGALSLSRSELRRVIDGGYYMGRKLYRKLRPVLDTF